ncbi:MAG: phosphonate ABC transporter, permease protein PhnE [Proteobacteria bacterium]|jgi:phosphonate transport system permease protein|nr:phosphonate ABC transporter, permease protein PhnE [Pseudomonadota bacterium]MDA0854754.1 phosphonate ABC transporter, permease protein PhnE [Pseudomonadota bacterium]
MSPEQLIRLERQRNLYSGLILLVLGFLLTTGFHTAESLNSGGFVQGLYKFFDYPSQIVEQAIAKGWPDFFVLFSDYLPALIETINIALFSTIIGALGATIVSLGSTKGLDVPNWLIPIMRRIMDLMRAFPELIIALFLIFLLGAGPVPAAIAVAFHTVGALGKFFSEVNENIDLRQVEGLKACGASWINRIRFGVLPQVLPNYTSYFLLRLEINVRASAILGFVGAGGIGTELSRSIGWGKGADTAAIFLLLFFTIFLIDQLSNLLRKRMIVGIASGSAE